jgi:hypothetical protein
VAGFSEQGNGTSSSIKAGNILTIRWCIRKFPDWLPGARTANGTALCHLVQLFRYILCQSSEFCRLNPLCCFSTSVCF